MHEKEIADFFNSKPLGSIIEPGDDSTTQERDDSVHMGERNTKTRGMRDAAGGNAECDQVIVPGPKTRAPLPLLPHAFGAHPATLKMIAPTRLGSRGIRLCVYIRSHYLAACRAFGNRGFYGAHTRAEEKLARIRLRKQAVSRLADGIQFTFNLKEEVSRG